MGEVICGGMLVVGEILHICLSISPLVFVDCDATSARLATTVCKCDVCSSSEDRNFSNDPSCHVQVCIQDTAIT